MSEPVRVWVANDDDGVNQGIFIEKPIKDRGSWASTKYDCFFPTFSGISVPPGECREYVLIPTDQYRQPTAELSPVAKLIAELAHKHCMTLSTAGPQIAYAVRESAEIVTRAIAAAREIEGAKQ